LHLQNWTESIYDQFNDLRLYAYFANHYKNISLYEEKKKKKNENRKGNIKKTQMCIKSAKIDDLKYRVYYKLLNLNMIFKLQAYFHTFFLFFPSFVHPPYPPPPKHTHTTTTTTISTSSSSFCALSFTEE
jgi:hypothetical protein